MIGIVDYGLGNILAIANIYKKLGIASAPASTAKALAQADKLILPGVGSFDWAMRRLSESGLRESLDAAVLRDAKPVLGICVGMQMMAERSEEGTLDGLGWLPGDVRRFHAGESTSKIRLPHMGWNCVQPKEASGLFSDLGQDIRFYFLHSYFFTPTDSRDVLAKSDYHGLFTCSAGRGNIFGVQFHPEKSHQWGVQLLKNFAEL